MPKLPFTFSGETLSVYAKKKLHTIPKEHLGYAELCAYLKSTDDHNEDHVMELVDMRAMVTRLTAGKVSVIGESVFYNGAPIHTTLSQKLMQVLDAGEDAGPWARFLDNHMLNPDPAAREGLYDFLAKHNTPLTEDGCFVAWKYVSDDYKSMHASPDGTHIDHTPGQVVEMPREECDADPHQTCSRGLHCCASPYLGGYSKGRRILKVKVNPKDVVAVPKEYKAEKMRVCRYYVLEEVFSNEEIAAVDKHVITNDVSQTEATIPDELVDLPVIDNKTAFDAAWARERSGDIRVGDLVVQPGSYLIGKVIDIFEDFDDGAEYKNEEGDWEEDEDDRSYYFVYGVVWQNGMETEITEYEGDSGALTVVSAIPTEEPKSEKVTLTDDQMAAIKKANTIDVTGFFTSTDGRTFTPRELIDGIEAAGGQRAYCRETGLKRSTLQGWLSKIDHDALKAEEKTYEVEPGMFMTKAELQEAVQELGGQRAFSRKHGTPRSTLQGWLK